MRVVTVIGPTGSGKSTLVAAMGGLEGRAEKFEISAAVALHHFRFLDEDWAAIDIAGGADHAAYAGPALAASDAALVVVPPEADAAVLVASYLRLVEEAGVPAFIFVNRMDQAAERVRDIVAALQTYSGAGIVLRQVPMRDGTEIVGSIDLISERAWKYREGGPSDLIEIPDASADREESARTELLESLADFDDGLLEELIENKRPPTEELFDITARLAELHALTPAFLGAAEPGNGVFRLMKGLRHEVPQVEATLARLGGGEIRAVAALADVKKHAGKVVVIRAMAAGVKTGGQLGGGNLGSLTAIDGKTQVADVAAGSIALALKSDHLNVGQAYSESGASPLPGWAGMRAPSYRRIVAPDNERDETRLSAALGRLAEIDPGLSITQDETTGRAVIAGQGPLHAREISQRLADTFGVPIQEEDVPPEFRETISKKVQRRYRHRKQSGGAGQFADVVIEVKPTPRGSGFEFNDVVKGGAVPRNYIPAVQHGVEDSLVSGPKGHKVVDLAVTLLDGKHHAVDSSDYAFRSAGKFAMNEALIEAGPLVLQPIERVDIHVPSIFAGGLTPKIAGLKGQVLGFETNPEAAGWDIFSALLPAASRDDLFRSLGSATRGTAWAETKFDHYEEVYGNVGTKTATPA